MKTATGILSGVHSESARNLDLSIVTHHEKKKRSVYSFLVFTFRISAIVIKIDIK